MQERQAGERLTGKMVSGGPGSLQATPVAMPFPLTANGSSLTANRNPGYHVAMRLAFALLTTFCLLFQQVAVAASACMLDVAPAAVSAAHEHCASTGDMAKDTPALCKAHCAPDLAMVADYKWPPVDFVAILPPAVDLLFVPVLPDPGVPALPAVHRSDPPLRLRYCSLLI